MSLHFPRPVRGRPSPRPLASCGGGRRLRALPGLLLAVGFLLLLPGTGPWGPGEARAQGSGTGEATEGGFSLGIAARGSLLPPPPGVPLGARPSGYGGGVQLFVRTGSPRFHEVELTWLEHGTGNRPEEFQGDRLRLVGVLVHQATGDGRGRLRTGVHTGGAWVQAGGPRFRRSTDPDDGSDRPSALALAGGVSVGVELGAGFSLRLDPRIWVASSDEVWPNPNRLQPDLGVGLRWTR